MLSTSDLRLSNIIRLLLNKAPVTLQMRGAIFLEFLHRQVPTELYDDFNIPKHRSISALLSLNDLFIKICQEYCRITYIQLDKYLTMGVGEFFAQPRYMSRLDLLWAHHGLLASRMC